MTDLESFIVNQNLVHYKKLLREETDAQHIAKVDENEIAKLPASAERVEITKMSGFQ